MNSLQGPSVMADPMSQLFWLLGRCIRGWFKGIICFFLDEAALREPVNLVGLGGGPFALRYTG